MLELNHQSMRSFYVRNMNLASGIARADFLLFVGEMILPIAVPLGLVFPPMITVFASPMGPVPNLLIAAFRNHV